MDVVEIADLTEWGCQRPWKPQSGRSAFRRKLAVCAVSRAWGATGRHRKNGSNRKRRPCPET
ncbi:hypothetical protein Q9314_18925 (plasmid) [Shinella sumterensis]|nr:hypothetical protein Q9314_18925 [Shinella sumterensis]